jgi:hypothetical protein
MRRVRIIDEPDKTYPYAAIDRQTGEIPLRHHDRTELMALCLRLEWKQNLKIGSRAWNGV